MKPRYEHDCSLCVFVGQYNEYDLWYHDDENEPIFSTVIARYSSDGPDYTSGLCFVNVIPALKECWRLALEKGIVSLNTREKYPLL